MGMRIWLALTMFLTVCGSSSFAAALASNPITGTNPNTSNPYITGQTVLAGLTFSGIGRGPGISGTGANDRYNATGWNSASINLEDYFSFTLTPDIENRISYDNFVYTAQASGTGPTTLAFRSSLDSFGANIGTPTAIGTTITLGGPLFTDVATPVTFRLYAWGASASTGTFSVNDFTFNGSVTPVVSAVPEPVSIVVLAGLFGCAGVSARFRKRRKLLANKASI